LAEVMSCVELSEDSLIELRCPRRARLTLRDQLLSSQKSYPSLMSAVISRLCMFVGYVCLCTCMSTAVYVSLSSEEDAVSL